MRGRTGESPGRPRLPTPCELKWGGRVGDIGVPVLFWACDPCQGALTTGTSDSMGKLGVGSRGPRDVVLDNSQNRNGFRAAPHAPPSFLVLRGRLWGKSV